ncbi:MAG TPA: alpha/beta hydrolase family protein [Actinopolymorphaceae bacterium]|nr:alpha/beta hydrolase family protein [Actinopolymorphaceae bacterium]
MTAAPTRDDLSIRTHVQAAVAATTPRYAVDRADLGDPRLAGEDGAGEAGVEGGAAAWRTALRTRLHELLNDAAMRVDPAPEVVESVDDDGYTRSLLRFQTEPGVTSAAWLLVPPGARERPAPGVLALHGHGRGKDDVVGIWPEGDRDAEEGVRGHHYDFARQLARRGYVVLAPDARGFGERAADGCHVGGLVSLYLGRPVAGQRLWDDQRALDLLAGLPEVDAARLGCVGLSEGGKRTLFLSALDERIACAVVSGYFTTLRQEVQTWDRLQGWDICNPVPGLLAVADLPDVAALVAPRPLLIQHGRDDGLYSLAHVESGFATAAKMWARCGRSDAVKLDVFDGGHRWNGDPAYAWIDSHLA